MSEPIMVALIGLLGSAIGSLLGILANSKMTNYRLEQLEKRVEAHNNLIDRTYKLEAHEHVIDEEIEHLKEEVKHLEKRHEQND